MSIEQSEVVAIVAGLLSDPGTSSKDTQRVVARAVDYVKEVGFQVKKENDKDVVSALKK